MSHHDQPPQPDMPEPAEPAADGPAGSGTAQPQEDDLTERLTRDLVEQRTANIQGMRELMAQRVRPPDAAFLDRRLEALVELLGMDAQTRLHFELIFERKVAALLAETATQANQARLLAPGEDGQPPLGSPPGLFLPGQ